MSVKSSIDLICRSLPNEQSLMSSLAYLDSLITKKPIQPETIRIEPHDMYNQKRIKEQAMRFQEEWFY